MSEVPPLTQRNYLNIFSYIANAVITYGIGVLGAGGAQTNEYLSLKYQTLVTPASWAFIIWGVIFLAQAAFVVAQALPDYRASTLVQDTVKDYYVGACGSQIIWTFSFSREFIGLSFLAMLVILFMLVRILQAQYELDDEAESRKEYWLMRFPFEVHTGWILAASFVNLNVWLTSLNASTAILLSFAIISLICVLALGLLSIWSLNKHPQFVVAFVLAWAMIGVSEELRDPKQSIFNEFSDSTIAGVQIAAAVVATIIFVAFITRAAKLYMKQRSKALTLCGPGPASQDAEENDISADYVKA